MVYVPKSNFQHHPFHLVSPSPWPMYTGLSVFFLATSGVLLMHGFELYSYMFFVSLFNVVYSMGLWFRDVVAESTYLGKHTSAVQSGINMGIGLFLLGEAFFFLAMFWAFFHSSISPSVELGAQWPPMGMEGVNPFELPLLNTVILLSSGVTMTYAHHSLIQGNSTGALYGTLLTIMLGLVFTCLQGIEYSVSSFTISDSVYGSCFYLGTGFHGIHVIMGTAFLSVGFWRLMNYHLTDHHHLGYESGILYWHFVDVVWLMLYVSIYYWGY